MQTLYKQVLQNNSIPNNLLPNSKIKSKPPIQFRNNLLQNQRLNQILNKMRDTRDNELCWPIRLGKTNVKVNLCKFLKRVVIVVKEELNYHHQNQLQKRNLYPQHNKISQKLVYSSYLSLKLLSVSKDSQRFSN